MLNGSHIAYYHICHRKLWIYSQGVWMEDNSELVLDGRLLHETAYPERADRYREVAVESIKIDHYDPKEGAIREIKKSDRLEKAHIAQLKYYLYVLERNSITANYGVLEYPSFRKTKRVELSDEDHRIIAEWERDIGTIIGRIICPPSHPQAVLQALLLLRVLLYTGRTMTLPGRSKSLHPQIMVPST